MQERPGIRRNGGGYRFSLRPEAGQAEGRFRRERGVGVSRGELGGRGAGVDGPAGSVFGGPVPGEVFDGLVAVVGDDVDVG